MKWLKLLCCIMLMFIGPIHQIIAQNLIFKHLSEEDGLSNNIVNCIFQDRQGFMWFGTREGLCRYDGYQFKTYESNPSDSTELSSNFIWDIEEDSEGNIWIANPGDFIDVFIPPTQAFQRYVVVGEPIIDSLKSEITGNKMVRGGQVSIIYKDKSDRIWLGNNDGINVFEAKDTTFTFYVIKSNNEQMSSVTVMSMIEDRNGIFWIGTYDGLRKFNPTTKEFLDFVGDTTVPKPIASGAVMAICEDSIGTIWIGTQQGSFQYDSAQNKFKPLENDPKTPEVLTRSDASSILQDRDGIMWFGNKFKEGGLALYNQRINKYISCKNKPQDDLSLSNNTVHHIYEDKSGVIWVATSLGLNIFDPMNKNFTDIRDLLDSAKVNVQSMKHFHVSNDGVSWFIINNRLQLFNPETDEYKSYHTGLDESIEYINQIGHIYPETDKELVWIGSWDGLTRIDLSSSVVTQFPTEKKGAAQFLGGLSGVRAFCSDANENYWAGTGQDFFRFNSSTGKYSTVIAHDSNSIDGSITDIHHGSRGNLWVGTSTGFYDYSPSENTIKKYVNTPDDTNSISGRGAYTIFEDKHGKVWLGGGLQLFDPELEQFKSWSVAEGRPRGVVFSITDDESGNVWLATGKGLTRFNPVSGKFDVFENYTGSLYKTKNKLYCGYHYFDPLSIKGNSIPPEIVFTNFQIFNKPVGIRDTITKHVIIENGNYFLSKDISQTDAIVLSYKESVFSFEFAGLHYINSSKNEYAYMMQGFDKDWHFVNNIRTATYTNLDPGKYVFKVKACNSDGIWNEEGVSMHITITPPWWQTWRFRALLVIAIILLIIAYIKWREQNLKRDKKVLEEKVKERTEEVTRQKKIVDEKNKDITDSIRYAKGIQQALLPSEKEFANLLPNSFVLFRPKDIVSGDFHWLTEKDNKVYFVAADCTGHGVPGGFMSMISSSLLTEAVNEKGLSAPSDIFNEVRKGLINALKQTGEMGQQKDGMDAVICSWDRKDTLEFAAAYNPFILIRNGELIETKPDKMPVGFHDGEQRPYTNHKLKVKKNDTVYIFSDGYQDQFGGPKGKKFMIKRMKQLLVDIQQKTMTEQKEILEKKLEEWMGSTKQVDDILVIGVRF